MATIDLAMAALESLLHRVTSIMDFVFDSKLLIALVSCVMALVFMVHLRSTAVILHTLYYPKSSRSLIHRQLSPINIVRRMTFNLKQSEMLQWNCYNELPTAVVLQNNGWTVVMQICCTSGFTPYLSGGSLPGKYYYVETIFKWGTSEHSIDSHNYDLEMQVLHATDLPGASYEYLTVSYLFALTAEKNLFLDQIVDNLWAIRNAGSAVELPPFDQGLWCFRRNYYTYSGTYTNGNVELPSEWIICSRILYLAPEQLAKFLTLYDVNNRIIAKNSRKRQPLGDRCVVLNY